MKRSSIGNTVLEHELRAMNKHEKSDFLCAAAVLLMKKQLGMFVTPYLFIRGLYFTINKFDWPISVSQIPDGYSTLPFPITMTSSLYIGTMLKAMNIEEAEYETANSLVHGRNNTICLYLRYIENLVLNMIADFYLEKKEMNESVLSEDFDHTVGLKKEEVLSVLKAVATEIYAEERANEVMDLNKKIQPEAPEPTDKEKQLLLAL